MINDIEKKIRSEKAYKFVDKHGTTLWHYTDFNAIDGILNKKELWLSSTANVNDSKELIGFINNLKQSVLNCVSDDYEDKVYDIFNEINKHSIQENSFVFCTSKARNDAAQWERYADKGEGVAIAFDTENLFKLFFYNDFIMNEEYYTIDTKQHQICKLLVQYIQTNEIEGFSNLDGLIDNMILCAMLHKHESFSSEQEIRIAPFFVKEGDSHIQFKIGKVIKRVYVLDLEELCRKENMSVEDLIDYIVIAPKSQQNIEDLKYYCRNIGLNKLADKIIKSDCPLR